MRSTFAPCLPMTMPGFEVWSVTSTLLAERSSSIREMPARVSSLMISCGS